VRCKLCGCTDERGCVDPLTGVACHWVAPELCSHCVSTHAGTDIEQFWSEVALDLNADLEADAEFIDAEFIDPNEAIVPDEGDSEYEGDVPEPLVQLYSEGDLQQILRGRE